MALNKPFLCLPGLRCPHLQGKDENRYHSNPGAKKACMCRKAEEEQSD